jgi:Ser/Thr protein kinase RdoA (MazF antagonist)
MTTLKTEVAISLPQVITGVDGRSVQALGDSYDLTCCMFSFLSGVPLHNLQGEALSMTLAKLGSLAASMHLHSMQDSTTYDRFAWNWEALFGEESRWGDWKAYKGLVPGDEPFIEQVLQSIQGKLISYGKDRSVYGLIHSDLHVSNVLLAKNGSLQVIDFDDCGYGWYLYDIACMLTTYCEDLEGLSLFVLQGYEQVRPLTQKDREMLSCFILIRRIARFAWLASHSESDTAKTVDNSLYREVTMIMCNEVLNGGY